MVDSSRSEMPARYRDVEHPELAPDRSLLRWGGAAGMAGSILLIASAVVVGALGLPDASDVETLTDFAGIESGRIAEHFLYLGALMLFALATIVLYRLLRAAQMTAALFATVFAEFGLVIMAASSLLHVSTAPLSELYTATGTPAEDLRAIEYAWHGAQSIFDTMLTTGMLLVPIGIVLFGVAMWRSLAMGTPTAVLAIVLGLIGVVGGVIAVVEPGSMAGAAAVLAIGVFHLSAGWVMFRLARGPMIDLS
jgi:hypothetical protein